MQPELKDAYRWSIGFASQGSVDLDVVEGDEDDVRFTKIASKLNPKKGEIVDFKRDKTSLWFNTAHITYMARGRKPAPVLKDDSVNVGSFQKIEEESGPSTK